uniref:Uncharacterized protein n=1 Tax=Plectus sambesii TaxID=2011161 RepID=A0A914XEV0_9BILA
MRVSGLVEHPDGGRPQQLPDSKLAPSPAIAVPLNASPPTTTAKVYVHNDSVVFDRPDGGALPRPKVVEPAGADGGHIRPPGEEEGVMAAPDVSNPRDKVVFDRAPAGGSLAEVANNEGPGVRRLKQPDDGEEAVGAVPKNGEEEVAVGAAPKNDAAEADANG